jgi:Escherichia/Staphylococcus phage prohead protease
MDGSSFSFNVDPDGDEWDYSGDLPIRTVTSVRDLFDVGPVTYPAYLDATAAIRSLRTRWPQAFAPLSLRSAAQRRRLFLCRFPNLKG